MSSIKKIVVIITFFFCYSPGNATPPSGLFISEYVEGLSNDKAIEIFNGTKSDIDLQQEEYVLQFYFNGSNKKHSVVRLNGVIPSGKVFVIAHDSASFLIKNGGNITANQTSSTIWFNGNDAVLLRKGGIAGAVVDVIGQLGFDPGQYWGSGMVTTKDHSLIRKNNVCEGNTNLDSPFNPYNEWLSKETELFSDLGKYYSLSITSQPVAVVACSGTEVSFSVSATYATSYRWQVDQGAGFTDLAAGGMYAGVGSEKITLTGVTSAVNNYKYRCVVGSSCGVSIVSASAALGVKESVVFTSQPVDVTTCSGKEVSFSVAATHASSYRWQVDQGAGFTDLAAGGIYAGVGSEKLSLTGVTSAVKNYKYRCVVGSSCGVSSVSASAGLVVKEFVQFTSQPVDVTTCAGSEISFSVSATYATSYRWQVDQGAGFTDLTAGGMYAGVGSEKLTLTGVTSAVNNFKYRCVVGSSCGESSVSASAGLVVKESVQFTSQPVSVVACSGSEVSFSVSATHASSYQWQVDQGAGFTDLAAGGIYAGVGSEKLSLTGVTSAVKNYKYRCVVGSSCGVSSVSASAGLVVKEFVQFTSQPVDVTTCAGSEISFSVSATYATSYRWQVDQGAGFTDLTAGGMYAGVGSEKLTLTGVTSAVNNFKYRCVVGSSCGESSVSASAGLVVKESVQFTSQPVSVVACSGSEVSFSVSATHASSYQWQVDQGSGFTDLAAGGMYAGVGSEKLMLTGVTATNNNYKYRCVMGSSCGVSSVSAFAGLVVKESVVFTSQPVDVTTCSGSEVSFSVSATHAISYRWQVDQGTGFTDLAPGGMYAGVGSEKLMLTGVTAAVNNYNYRCVAGSSCGVSSISASAALVVKESVVFTSQPVDVTTCSGSEVSFSVSATQATSYRWQVDQGAGFTDLTAGGMYAGVGSEKLMLTGLTPAVNNYKYRCVVGSFCGVSSVSASAALVVKESVQFTSQPVDVTTCSGSEVSFSVSATQATSYKWQVDQGAGFTDLAAGGMYAGVGSEKITLTGLTSAVNNYKYRCVVGSSCGVSSVSASAGLVVKESVVFTSQPVDVTTCSGSEVSFSVSATQATSYQWQVDQGAGFTDLAAGGMYAGVGSEKITLTGVTSAVNNYKYRCVVGSSCGESSVSASAGLVVKESVQFTSQPTEVVACSGREVSFSVSAKNATSYQWQVDQGAGFTDLAAGEMYAGVGSEKLTIKGYNSELTNYTFICKVSDFCNNAITSKPFKIISNDSISPTVNNCPKNIAVKATSGTCGALVEWIIPTANDNCRLQSFTSNFNSGDIFTSGITTVKYEAKDVSGNSTFCTFDIEVTDTQKPVFYFMPGDVEIEAGFYSYKIPLASDNCGKVNIVLKEGKGSNNYFVNSSKEVYEAVDQFGNKVTKSFNITVSSITSINKNLIHTNINVFPNPANDYLHLEIKEQNIKSIKLEFRDLTGRISKQEFAEIKDGQCIMDIRDLQKGAYLLNIIVENRTLVKKVIVN